MTNNKEYRILFVIKENAHLIAQFHFLNGVVPGQSVMLVTISNTGTPFGQDFVYTQYRIQGPSMENPVIIGIDQTRRDHLRTGDTANEQFSFMAPMAPGDYIVIAEVDYTGIVNQSDRSGEHFRFLVRNSGCARIVFEVLSPRCWKMAGDFCLEERREWCSMNEE